MIIIDVMNVLANSMVVIILKYIKESNKYLKLTQCYMLVMSQLKTKKKRKQEENKISCSDSFRLMSNQMSQSE